MWIPGARASETQANTRPLFVRRGLVDSPVHPTRFPPQPRGAGHETGGDGGAADLERRAGIGKRQTRQLLQPVSHPAQCIRFSLDAEGGAGGRADLLHAGIVIDVERGELGRRREVPDLRGSLAGYRTGGPAPKDEGLRQRVAGQPVGAVDPRAGDSPTA